MKTLRSKRLEIFVTMSLILMGLSCIAYSSWSWAGVSAWCAKYPDGVGTSSASVGWGGMAEGLWSTYASLDGYAERDSGGFENAGGGGSSYRSNYAMSGAAAASVGGNGLDGQTYSDSDSDSF